MLQYEIEYLLNNNSIEEITGQRESDREIESTERLKELEEFRNGK